MHGNFAHIPASWCFITCLHHNPVSFGRFMSCCIGAKHCQWSWTYVRDTVEEPFLDEFLHLFGCLFWFRR